MIRVLHVVHRMDRGGAETFIMNVYRNIDRDKFQFDFYLTTPHKGAYDDEILALGGRIYRGPSRREAPVRSGRALAAFFADHPEYSVVHTHCNSLSNTSALSAATKANVPIRIIHAHSTRASGSRLHVLLHYLHYYQLKKIATTRLACSAPAGRWVFGGRDFSVVYPGIDSDRFQFSETVRQETRAKLGLGNRLVVGHVGRFALPKNHAYLIKVFREIHDRDSNAVLVLVGDGPLRPAVEESVKQHGLEASVVFLGLMADVSAVYQALDIFLFPSLWEGFPLALVEAQASGLRCVASDSIAPDAKVLDSFLSLPLSKRASDWAEAVLLEPNSSARTDAYAKVRQAGLDIMDAVAALSRIYQGEDPT